MPEESKEALLAEIARLKAELARATGSEAAATLLSDKLATMGHDLRSPLNAIIGFTELLRDGTITDAKERQQALEDVLVAGRRLLKLINQLLAGVRPDAAKKTG